MPYKPYGFIPNKHETMKNFAQIGKRRITQLVSLVLLHSSWGPELKWFCNPVLSCHSCALSWFACPIGVYVHYSGYHLFPFLAVGMVLLLGSLFGRLLCGWVCPFGLVQDLLHKIPSRKFALPAWTAYGKYLVLVLGVFLLPFIFGENTLLSFCRVCPSATLQVALPALVARGFHPLGPAVLVRLGVLGVILLAAVYSRRAFCKTICPIGAILAPLNFVSLWVVKTPTERCVSCKKCDRACTMGVSPSANIKAGTPASRQPDCIACHECAGACPMKGREERFG